MPTTAATLKIANAGQPVPVDGLGCVHHIIEHQVRLTPDDVAIVFEDRRLTYAEMNRRANELAHHLIGSGVAPDVIVGVGMDRSAELVIAILAILKAGGAYLPIDPTHPEERRMFMLQDAAAHVLLTQTRFLSGNASFDGKVIDLDCFWEDGEQRDGSDPAIDVSHTNLVYVIYTSGSTGKPKGVMNEHAGVVNRLLWMQHVFKLGCADHVLQKTPATFDVSAWELFWPLMTGAQLVVARPEGHLDPAYLLDEIERSGITTIHFVPSMARAFLRQPDLRQRCRSLRLVFCSGEVLPLDLQNCFFASLDAEVHNLYGPTEAAIDVTHWKCDPQSDLGFVPIGRPVWNTSAYVLDSDMRCVPVGGEGELYIGGVQVARGYVNRPDLTAHRFIRDPFAGEAKARLYRTGDLVRQLSDKNLAFVGRIDTQIKLRGVRIEPSEIESALSEYPAVQEAVVTMVGEGEEAQLCAYLVTSVPTNANDLRAFLDTRLPRQLVPAFLIFLDSFPLTHSGKLDRRALPPPERVTPDAYMAPRTADEKRIADIWGALLKTDRVGVRDNFFGLGGHSILALQVVGQIQTQLKCKVTLADLFEHPTVEQLAAKLDASPDEQIA